MTLVTLEKVARTYGDVVIFEDVSLRIEDRARIGIVGHNGSGKTSLLEIVAGLEEADTGRRQARRDLKIAVGYQIPAIASGSSVLDYVLRGDGSFNALEDRIRTLEDRLAQTPEDEQTLREYGNLQGAFEAGGGFDRQRLCETVVSGIGFTASDRDKDASVLSGGEKSRLQLCSLMTAPADLLILDEPTNHLDLQGIAFLEGFVTRYPGAVAVVSHDRRFLDNVAQDILEVEAAAVTRYRGSYNDYRQQREREDLARSRAFKSQQEFIRKELDYIRRNMAGRMSVQAKGRLKRLQRLQRISSLRGERGGMKLKFQKGRGLAGQAVIEAEDLSVSTPDGRELIAGARFRIEYGETLGLLGRNGTGKTTLLRVVAGALPTCEESLQRTSGLRVGYFSQEMTDLPSSGTVMQALRTVDPQVDDKVLYDHLALFLFSDEEVDKDVATLSGGEKRRLSLARMTRSTYDLLCLDEPTNHLDIAAREALEEALAEYPGAVLLISHDREFLNAVVGRVFYIEDGRLRVFDGGLEQCLEQIDKERRDRKNKLLRTIPQPKARPIPEKPGKIRNPLMFERLEKRIMELEAAREELNEQMAHPDSYMDPDVMKALQERERAIAKDLAQAYREWENWN